MEKLLRRSLPVILGVFVLYWVYKDFDFSQAKEVLVYYTHWGWMLVSLLFGVLSHLFRAMRWRQSLEPLGTPPRTSECVDSVFLSYGVSLLIPRAGEAVRWLIPFNDCNITRGQIGGTLFMERIVDTVTMLLISVLVVVLQYPQFLAFLQQTGMKFASPLHLFSSPWFYILLLCLISVAVVFILRLKRAERDKQPKKESNVKLFVKQGIEGVLSLKHLNNKPLYLLYTLLIWMSYFLHFYFTFYCFEFTGHLGVLAGLVMFVGGTYAVLVPTPNGAGPWHFAIITLMMLYGVSATDAALFALIVHAIQTLLVVVLGVWGGWHLVTHSKKLRNESFYKK